MFSDPTSVTVATVAQSLPRVSVGNMQSIYRSADGALELSIAHSANKRERSVVKLTSNKVGVDPFDSTRSRAYTAQTYLVIDSPLNGAGFTDTELKDLVIGLADLIKSTNFATKILGKES